MTLTDTLGQEFKNTIKNFAVAELKSMNIPFNELDLIRYKDGIAVWRVVACNNSYVIKSFDKAEYRREIANYKLLNSIGVPTLKLIAHTESSFVMEDIEKSEYRLGLPEDMNNPKVAGKIALWYKTLHHNGRKYANTHDFIDEYDELTLKNLLYIQKKTDTLNLPVWNTITKHFAKIKSVVMQLPRTLTYTDFYYTNLAVARDGSKALMFDYNFFYKSYVYSDIRNVCSSLGNEETKEAFLSFYGKYDTKEIAVDQVVSELHNLFVACQRESFPSWAHDSLAKVKDGRLLNAVEDLLKQIDNP